MLFLKLIRCLFSDELIFYGYFTVRRYLQDFLAEPNTTYE